MQAERGGAKIYLSHLFSLYTESVIREAVIGIKTGEKSIYII